MKKTKFLGIFGFLLLIACSSNKKDLLNSKRNVEDIYKDALNLLKTQEYTEAAEVFKDIDTLFPYSEKAAQSEILSAYSYFLAKNYIEALREISVFLKYHPANKLIPYALYLKAMCFYAQVVSVGRDIGIAKDAKEAFMVMLNSYPDSKYSKDAMKKIRLLDNLCAAHEMSIARFYQKRDNMLSAIGRYNYVVGTYSNTKYVPEAFYRMIECFLLLNLKSEALNAYKVMEKDFSNDSWTKKACLLMKPISK